MLMSWLQLLIGFLTLFLIRECATPPGETGSSTYDKTEKVKLAYGDTVRYDLGFFGDEEGARIIKRPVYNVFEEFCSDNREPLIYCYTATARFEGADTVVFRISTGSDGASPKRYHQTKALIIELEDN
jgi:hypothetical protein